MLLVVILMNIMMTAEINFGSFDDNLDFKRTNFSITGQMTEVIFDYGNVSCGIPNHIVKPR